MTPEGGVGVALPRRNRRCSSSRTADSGDEICRPGGVFAGGRRGETERRNRATYRLGKRSNRAGSNEELRGRNRRARSPAEISARGGRRPDRWVWSVSGGQKKMHTGSGRKEDGPRARFAAGLNRMPRGPFLYFFLFFFFIFLLF
jgi:hypothetical protein